MTFAEQFVAAGTVYPAGDPVGSVIGHAGDESDLLKEITYVGITELSVSIQFSDGSDVRVEARERDDSAFAKNIIKRPL